jgi:hypothetical protein
MNLLKKIDFFYRLATIKLAQVIDKTTVNPLSLDPYGDRVVASDKEKFDLTPKKVNQSATTHNNKPHGVWYAFGSSWISHIGIEGGYAYRLKLDDSKLLKLGPHNISKFIDSYRVLIEGEDVARSMGIDVENLEPEKRMAIKYMFQDKPSIDWGKVAERYAGVEIRDFDSIPRELRSEWRFLESWDIDSGCVFDTSIIKDAIKLGTIPDFSKEEDSYPFMGGYWGESPDQMSRMFKDKSGLVLGSSLSDYDLKWLSTRLTQYNIHLTYDQLSRVEFLVAPNSITLKKVPDAPSYDGKVINL